ncbi:DNA polymerase III subunit gamma/tau [Alistipes sp.]|uniref:DNA polymerase III subunit gamma/tau n=1 Tax=Alistipes sp. TaxID=1872444 RepID=UPI003AF02DEA
MSDFIVSARKYRPATFQTVVGQQHITSTLRNAIERGQLAHAYLFCGPRGVGKTTCARIFAKAINCLNPNGSEACNTCESCRSFNEGRSMNIHELDAASNNSVEDIRTLIEQVRIIPQVGRYSVFIIDEVHMLSAAAFNAFLKTLEEPPAHAIFILATTEKHKIIPTILSRCQIYDFNRIRVEDGVEYLKYIASEEGIAADEESLNLIAQKADGGMRDALSMFDKAVSFCGQQLDYRNVARTLNVLDYDTYFNVTELLVTGRYAEALIAFDGVLAQGFSGQTFMAGLNRHMRDLLMAKRADTLRLIEMTGTLLERYRVQAEACDTGFLFGAIALLTELDGKIRQSSSQRLLVELGLMKIAGLGQKKNDSLTPAAYPLPELTPRTATATTGAASPATGEAAATTVTSTQATGAAAASTAAKAAPEAPATRPTVPATAPAAETPVTPVTPAIASPAASAAESAAESAAPEAPAAESAGPTTERPVAPAPAIPTAETSAETTAATAAPRPTAPVRQEPPATQTAGPVPPQASELSRPEPPATTAAPQTSRPAAAAKPARRPLISGTSLSELLSGVAPEEPANEETADEPEVPAVDPDCAVKLERARSRILALIQQRRPRFVAAFEQMKVSGNTISLSVPTQELREEILRTKTSMLLRIAELAGVRGMIELEIAVNEQIRAARPFKLEDRVRFITEKNPLVAELRKALDLEAE